VTTLIIAGSVVAFLVLVALLSRPILTAIGNWLVIADPLQSASCILVLGGYLPFRAMEGAAIHRGGWAPEVWLTQYPPTTEECVLAGMGIEITPEYRFSSRVLQHCGVPASAIRVLERPSLDTEEEIRFAFNEMRVRQLSGPIIIVTSKTHARRVKVLWKALTGSVEGAIVRYTNEDPFRPDRWFRNTRDINAVAREFFGVLNVWAGFPIRARRT
jgi:uncharacterized SAM-binding protein YcdF (DUF218 family)